MSDALLWDAAEFQHELRAVGESAYHDKHPFHRAMNEGRLNAEQLRGWAANRYHYQRHIPIKDAAILSNCPLAAVRRLWIHRIHDHDGGANGDGGLEAWVRLSEAVGLSRNDVLSGRHVLPGVRFAVDGYVQLARTAPWPVAIASSLTELFAPDLVAERVRAFEAYYPWIPTWGLTYFRTRVTQGRVDSNEAMRLTLTHCNTPTLQREAVAALAHKCDILWTMLDSITVRYAPELLTGAPVAYTRS